jgi:hypothetical protein
VGAVPKRIALPVLALVALATLGVHPATSQSESEPDVFRKVEVVKGELETSFSCGPFDCVGFSALGEASATFPDSMGKIHVTVTMSFEYETTPGDGATVFMSMKSPGGTFQKMQPGRYFLRAGKSTGTSVTWVRKHVQPTSEEHKFRFGLGAGKGTDNNYRITATEIVVLIEATPS